MVAERLRSWAVRLVLGAYVGLLCLAAAAVIAAGLLLPLHGPALVFEWWGVGCLLMATLVTERMAVPVPTTSAEGSYTVSVATIPHMIAALLLPPPLPSVVAGTAMLLDEARSRHAPIRVLFNVASTTLTVGVTSLLASLLDLTGAHLGMGDGRELLRFLLVAATYYAANTVAVAGVGAIRNRDPFWMLLANARFTAPAEVVAALLGGVAAFIWVKNPYWLPLGLCPAAISQLALSYIAANNRKTTQLMALDRLGQSLSATLTVEEVAEALQGHLTEQAGVEGAALRLDDGSLLRTMGVARPKDADTPAPRLLAAPDTTPSALAPRDAVHERACLDRAEMSPRGWLSVPLRVAGTAIGYLDVAAEASYTFSDEDKQFFTLVGERVSAAIENARRAAELSHLAYHDALTGLPNRVLLLDRLEHALLRARGRGSLVGLIFLDLDNFKIINDSLGHQAGDVLLGEVSRRLQAAVREYDVVARLGGDEFTVLLEDLPDQVEAQALAERISAAMKAPIPLGAHAVVASSSMGIALSGPGRDRAEGLVRAADLAMYEAKAEGKARYAVFDPSMEQRAHERLEVESDLRRALERDEFRVYYQPIVRLTDGRIIEVEALVRWQHPERGLVPPSVFIPVAEETGLIVPIGQRVLEIACQQLRSWSDELPRTCLPSVSVNLSARQFQQPTLLADIQDTIGKAGIEARRLKLEITESVVMRDAERATSILHQLKGLGIQLAIDDFGTGYSSLAYLKRFPVDTLKIDRSFVDGLGHDAQDTAIVHSIVALARTLNLGTTAEGIELPEQRAQLQKLGCDLGQGYLFARPLPADTLAQMLQETATGALPQVA
jgi:diguanylate cyclase (GGDEF)-like protein